MPDRDRIVRELVDLLAVPSPTGFAHGAIEHVATRVELLGVPTRLTRKGALLWTLAGSGTAGPRALAAHVDTLGAMVKEVLPSGRLRLTAVGGYDWATVEGEHCLVHTAAGRAVTGTVVNVKQSLHVFGNELRDLKRDDKTLEVRLDEVVHSAADASRLGIEVGDFVSWDPRTTVLPSGYVKARFLDDKAAVAVLLEVTRLFVEHDLPLAATTHFFISNYEETGHGAAAGIPEDVEELLAVDMAAIGPGQNSSEHHATLCLKDSSGPYDHKLGLRLRQLARTSGIELRTDTYPVYNSDASAALRAGGEFRAALVGPGVDASHAYERTHTDALVATARLLLAYLRA